MDKTQERLEKLNRLQESLKKDLYDLMKKKSPGLHQYAKYMDDKEEKMREEYIGGDSDV